MLDRDLTRCLQDLRRHPDDSRAWHRLADLLRRGAPASGSAPLALTVAASMPMIRERPHDRTLVEALFPGMGLDLMPPAARAPGSFWAESGRLGEGSHFYDSETGMPLFLVARSTGTLFAWVPPGGFRMGAPGERNALARQQDWYDWYEYPGVEVCLPRGFWMSVYETTQREFRDMMGWNPEPREELELPASRVDWYEARDFCRALTQRLGTSHPLGSCLEVRLPGEAEWEHACRAFASPEPPGGELHGPLPENAVFREGERCADVAPGGSRAPNPFGLHDMLGNLEEWCLDGWHQTLETVPPDGSPRHQEGTETPEAVVHDGRDLEHLSRYFYGLAEDESRLAERIDAHSPGAGSRLIQHLHAQVPEKVVRGGHSGQRADRVRSTVRSSEHAGKAWPWLGFRVLLELRIPDRAPADDAGP